MKDLAPIKRGRRRNFKFSPSVNILRVGAVVVLFLLVGIVVWNKFFAKEETVSKSGNISTGPFTVSEAPRGLVPVDVGERHVISGGVELKTQEAVLKDVKYGGRYGGTATRSFGGGTYVLTVEANIPDPINVNYMVWVASGTKAVPIDVMKGSKNSWSLSLRDTDKFSSYNKIWVTLERTKDSKVEEHVLEGTFQ